MYLIDTNVVSELRRTRPHGAVIAWLTSVDGSHCFLSAVTLGEIQTGAEQTRRRDAAKAAEIDAFADRLVETYQVLAMDASIFRLWARLIHGRSDTLYEDAMIAATAIVHRLTVVTRNIRDFAPFGVPVLDPFAFRAE